MSSSKESTALNSSLESNLNYSGNTVTKDYIKSLLKSRIFLGRYIERRLIDERIGYRDVVLVSAAEVELNKDLIEVQHKLRCVYPNIHWIGITDNEQLGHGATGTCLWTEINDQPFGPFWFQIRSIKFRDEEVIVLIKCLRHISDAYLEIEPILTGACIKNKNASNKQLQSNISLSEALTDITENLKSMFTITNIKEFITFLCAFVIAIFSGSTAFINFLGNFILALLRELSILINNGTPWFLGILDFVSKIIGGFYLLLAMFFRQNAPNAMNKRTLNYYNSPHRQTNQYDSRYID